MATSYDNVPNWPAGHVPTASETTIVTNLLEAGGTDGGLYSERILYKASTTTRASTTAFADDPELTCTLSANAVYWVEMHLKQAAITAAPFKTAWTVPSGASGNRNTLGPASDATDTNGDLNNSRFGAHNFTTPIVYGNRNNAAATDYVIETALVITTNAGTLALQWAQNVSNVTGTVLGAGSVMIVKRIS